MQLIFFLVSLHISKDFSLCDHDFNSLTDECKHCKEKFNFEADCEVTTHIPDRKSTFELN